MRKGFTAPLLLVVCGIFAATVRADIYAATAALEKKDYERAFQLFREIAELGRLEGQENLAISYVNGDGVKRDNVLGYGWAVIARENGGGAEMQSIIDQLAPHLSDEARRRVAELQAQFGREAVRKRLIPAPPESVPKRLPSTCTFKVPANPDAYYPSGAIRAGISGHVFLDFAVMPDGRAHHPRVMYGVPAEVFDEAGREVVLRSTFKPQIKDGVAVPCSMRIKVKFFSQGSGQQQTKAGDSLDTLRSKAEAGDPRSQLLLGLFLANDGQASITPGEGMQWLAKAAQAGLPIAQYLIGLYLSGNTMAAGETEKGRAWLALAAAAGQPEAQVAVASHILLSGADSNALDEARMLLERAVKSGNANGRYYLAALLAAAPDVAWRDPQRALDLLSDVMADVDIEPTALEIRAAAHAMLGNFAAAQKDQKRALSKARGLGWDSAPQKARLEKYQANEAWSGNLFAF